jgi:tetratricopeptide (TPR) repeat protein
MIAALPRVLNQDILTAIAPEAGELFSWLCGLPFVDRQAGSWAYHEVVRAAMLRLQLAQAPAEWRSSQAALARVNRRWAHAAADRTENVWAYPDSIDHASEEMYHLLCADPVKNLPKALASAVRAAERSILHARRWADLVADAGRDTGNRTLSDWGQRLRDGIHDSDLTRYFTHLIIDADLGEKTLILALEQRGRCHRLAGRLDQALIDFDHALELDPAVAWIMAERGEVCRLMGRYDEALADLNHTIELDPGYARAIGSRGRTYQVTGRYDEALADYNRAIELDPRYVWAIGSRGQIYQAMERYDEALADCRRAIELDPTQMWIMVERGETYRLMGHYDEALADFNRAIESGLADAEVIGSRGQAYQALGRYDEALADLNHAIELDPSMAWVIAERGRTYRALERYDEALADFSRGLEPPDDRLSQGPGHTPAKAEPQQTASTWSAAEAAGSGPVRPRWRAPTGW